MNIEEWKDIKNYEGIYQISNHGNVKSIRNNKLLRPGINSDGYYTVLLSKNGKQKSFKVHRLVAEHFLKEAIIQVNHKNGVKTDNNAENLEFVTARENVLHAWINGLSKGKYKNVGNSAKKIIQIDKDTNENIKIYNSVYEASELTGITNTAIENCLKGRSRTSGGYKWKYAV